MKALPRDSRKLIGRHVYLCVSFEMLACDLKRRSMMDCFYAGIFTLFLMAIADSAFVEAPFELPEQHPVMQILINHRKNCEVYNQGDRTVLSFITRVCLIYQSVGYPQMFNRR